MIPSLTPYPEADALIQRLLQEVQSLLGDGFLAMYLDGSLANGGFDQDSDIDFVVVTDEEVTPDQFAALQSMHVRLTQDYPVWGIQLEGSYISKRALRRYDPENADHPNLERGADERLKLAHHDPDWLIHRKVLRERGIRLAGPEPQALIDPVSAEELKGAVRWTLNHWWMRFPQEAGLQENLRRRGYQAYAVLSMCRIWYTLHFGEVTSKGEAARWAQEQLGEPWRSLIARAWDGRHHPLQEASAEETHETLDFITLSANYANQF